MELKDPIKIYTAETNLEATMIVEILNSAGLTAFAEEDQSGVSLWMFGVLNQFHQPNVWVEADCAQKAADLIRQFEERKRERLHPAESTTKLEVQCEDCGKVTQFPDSLNGTVQECSHCGAYVDVGELDWDAEGGW